MWKEKLSHIITKGKEMVKDKAKATLQKIVFDLEKRARNGDTRFYCHAASYYNIKHTEDCSISVANKIINDLFKEE